MRAVQIGMPNDAVFFHSHRIGRQLDEYPDGYALLDVEDILVRCTRGGIGFFFLRVAVEIEKINLVEALHQVLAHSAKSRVIEITVIRDEAENALASSLNAPLRPANEFHIIILKPFRVAFAQRLAVALVVITDERPDPLAFICAVTGVRRITENHQHWLMFFDFESGVRFV